MAERLYLVSCVARKGERRALAKDLYESTWFVLARARIEREGAPWFILSAKYGVLHPATTIAPYDETLNTMGVKDRRAWATRVKTQLDETLPRTDDVVVFAGRRYREFLDEYLRRRFKSVKVPMEGLRIGEQLRWLKHRVDVCGG